MNFGTQELESIMNMIQAAVKRGQRSTLQSLDAHVGVRKSLTYSSRHDSALAGMKNVQKWSDFSKKASQLIEDAVPHLLHCGDVVRPGRFLEPPPSTIACERPRLDLIDPLRRPCRELRWVTHYNSLWFKHARLNTHISSGKSVVIVRAVSPSDGLLVESWVCHSLYRCSGMLQRVELEDDGSQFLRILPFGDSKDLVFETTYDLFHRWFRLLHFHGVKSFMVVFHAAEQSFTGKGSLVLEDVEQRDGDEVPPDSLHMLTFSCDRDVVFEVSKSSAVKKTKTPTGVSAAPALLGDDAALTAAALHIADLQDDVALEEEVLKMLGDDSDDDGALLFPEVTKYEPSFLTHKVEQAKDVLADEGFEVIRASFTCWFA